MELIVAVNINITNMMDVSDISDTDWHQDWHQDWDQDRITPDLELVSPADYLTPSLKAKYTDGLEGDLQLV